MPRCENPFVVVAFDFGTTYSGYAFAYVPEKEDDINVQVPKWCPGGCVSQYVTYKTPTSVLLDTEGKFHSFGYEAEDMFARLTEDNKHKGWRLFRRFKMTLHQDKNVLRDITIGDLEGKPYYAMEIFSMAIHYLHEQAIDAIKLQRPSLLETDFQYVITVPAIWDIRAKCFMREAAEKAGIDGKRLELAHEPEAAALWCRHDSKEDVHSPGSKYMVVDLGGGTADISVHEVNPDKSIKVIHKASGGPWGGIIVDRRFLKYLENKYGNLAIADVRKNNIGDYFDIIREFENKKRSTTYQSKTEMIFSIPLSLREKAKQILKNGKSFLSSFFSNETQEFEPKLRIKSAEAEAWFEEPVTSVIHHIMFLLEHDTIKDFKTLLLVGGFGESKYVQERLRKELSGLTLIVPEEAGLAVLKGAVLFGINPRQVASRVMTYTYGIGVSLDFDANKHPIEKKVLINDQWKVKDVFEIFVKASEEVSVDQEVTHNTVPNGSVSLYTIYRTLSENTKYTTDPGCELLGEIKMKNEDNVPLEKQGKKITFMFGNTELLVKVYNTFNGAEEMISLDCLQ